MLSTRLVYGIAMAAALVGVLLVDELFAPYFPLWLFVSLAVAVLAALELVSLLEETAIRPSGNAVFGGVIALVLANWAPHLTTHAHALPQLAGRAVHDPMAAVDALAWPMMTYVGLLMFTFVAQSIQYQRPGTTMPTIAGTALALSYVGLLSSFLIQLRWLAGPYHGAIPVACLFATAKGADTGAYTVGRIFGRHKLWPTLSPNKTIEGAIGGLLFGVGFNLIAVAVAHYILHIHSLGWKAAIGYGIVVSFVSQLGDLMESMIKRDCERKDASATVPGFGGVLDVIDSALFAGPVAFGYWLLFGA